jgi:hypothetical protein
MRLIIFLVINYILRDLFYLLVIVNNNNDNNGRITNYRNIYKKC